MVGFTRLTIPLPLSLATLVVVEKYGLAALGARHEEVKAIANAVYIVRLNIFMI